MKPIISVEGLGKKYVIRHEGQTHYKSLREEIFEIPKKLFGRQENKEEFWALKDVGFDIMPGDRVGIIGRNGAGKSTLLKLLSRITEPTAGRINLRGRVASLLEVGTGFHPELSGRENIFLNGAILGMSREEVRAKFDEIVDFADVEKFLDTPVKRYSSGMYVRLAFAVAAHLEPEILIVDEVLAVGDAEFQKKCLGKMEEVSEGGGRTVLFVSHNMNAVQTLCNRCILLDGGHIRLDGTDIRQASQLYLGLNKSDGVQWVNPAPETSPLPVVPVWLAVTDGAGQPLTGPIANDQQAWVILDLEIRELDPGLTMGYALHDSDGHLLYWSYTTDTKEEQWPTLSLGRVRLKSLLPMRLLNEGAYSIEIIGGLHFRQWFYAPGKGPSVSFNIQGGLSDSPLWTGPRQGILAPVLSWVREDI